MGRVVEREQGYTPYDFALMLASKERPQAVVMNHVHLIPTDRSLTDVNARLESLFVVESTTITEDDYIIFSDADGNNFLTELFEAYSVLVGTGDNGIVKGYSAIHVEPFFVPPGGN